MQEVQLHSVYGMLPEVRGVPEVLLQALLKGVLVVGGWVELAALITTEQRPRLAALNRWGITAVQVVVELEAEGSLRVLMEPLLLVTLEVWPVR